MDHRISKDMISSGMSYTGAKSQSDLSRTQYGSAARPDALREAYASMYKKEEIQEAGGPALPGEPGRPGTPKAPGGRPHLPGEKETPAPKKKMSLQLAHADLFDIIKGHLMDEGLTEAAAIEMMVSMTEEERDAVIEELTPDQEQRRRDLSKAINKAGTPGYPGPNDVATRKMQGEYIKLQKLKGV